VLPTTGPAPFGISSVTVTAVRKALWHQRGGRGMLRDVFVHGPVLGRVTVDQTSQ
jgi:hypothetical protein